MIYNSFAKLPGGVDGMDPKNWVLRRKGKDGESGDVWQGGSSKASEARISEGDVARVCFVVFLLFHTFPPFEFLVCQLTDSQ